MRKEDLKDGMVLELRNEFKRIYINNRLYVVGDDDLTRSILSMKDYKNNLINIDERESDIMKISYQGEVLWERKEIDWSKVPIDTKVLVRINNNSNWQKRYFAKYEKGKVYTFMDGSTSWANNDENRLQGWNCYKLIADENVMDEYNKVDWSKIPIDTKVLVRDYPSEDWLRRYFIEYKNGRFYTYPSGSTSWNGKNLKSIPWNECKLATDED